MEEKVYMVRCTSGSWDDASWFVIGIYSTALLADEAKNKWLAELMQMRYEKYSKEEIIEFKRQSEEIEMLLTLEERENLRKFESWYYCCGLFDINIDCLKVEELPLNQNIYKFQS